DLDILYLDNLIVQTAELTVPHPRIVERRFVLGPLAEIRPELRLPGQSRSVAQLLAALRSADPISKIDDALDED
ncbi:MAG: 2-amino-4-hydroxy-6-hydroxymethyldihydropteridine diphosphokinase, partial [Verrucomicrobia bacterium]|nr:2-amino-4-hydroxy-6-hydroxymethyldihydropteridine diphosphokinase [Verrucomicrobiota bacterium]